MIIIDSSVLIAYHNIEDQNHQKATELLDRVKSGKYGSAHITDYIFDECVTVLSARIKNKEKSLAHCGKIKEFPIIKVDEEVFEEGWLIFKNQERLRLSFTDCTIIALIRKNIANVLATFDKDLASVPLITVVN